MSWISKFKKSSDEPARAFEKLVKDTVEQVKAGDLSMDHQGGAPIEDPGQPNITPSSSVTRGARDMQSTLSKTFTSATSAATATSASSAAETEAAAAGVGKTDTGKADTGKADTGKADTGKADTGKADTGKTDTGKTDTGKADTGKTDTGKTDTGKADSGEVGESAANKGVAPPGATEVQGALGETTSKTPAPLEDGKAGEPGGELSTDVKKTSRAERDMAAMKAAPDLKAMVRKEVLAGSIAIGVFVVFLFGWSAMAPLSSAAIAPGVISPHGSRKTVQHLEGGIIDRILVEEGSHVEAGDPLVLLEDTMARASWQLIRTQYYTLAARHARLGTLQSGAAEVYFPDWLIEEAGDPDVASILASEINLLETRRQAHHDRKAVLQQRIVQLEKEIEGLNAQIGGQDRQLKLIAKEIGGVQQLVDKGLERTPRLLGLQRTEAEIRAQRGSNMAGVSRTEQAISETELELIAADTVLQDEIAREMAQVQTELSQAGERMAASGDVLNRIEITAPVAGKVLDLRYHTAGGIIGPGAAILDIVPENEELIIEARVSPMDIDVVYENLTAQIHLSAFAQRNLPMITGVVRQVSADRLIDEVTGQPYFRAIVEVSKEEIARIGEGVVLTAGMPAEVMIVTGEQTLLGYLLKPVADTLRRSFREG